VLGSCKAMPKQAALAKVETPQAMWLLETLLSFREMTKVLALHAAAAPHATNGSCTMVHDLDSGCSRGRVVV